MSALAPRPAAAALPERLTARWIPLPPRRATRARAWAVGTGCWQQAVCQRRRLGPVIAGARIRRPASVQRRLLRGPVTRSSSSTRALRAADGRARTGRACRCPCPFVRLRIRAHALYRTRARAVHRALGVAARDRGPLERRRGRETPDDAQPASGDHPGSARDRSRASRRQRRRAVRDRSRRERSRRCLRAACAPGRPRHQQPLHTARGERERGRRPRHRPARGDQGRAPVEQVADQRAW